MEDLEDSGSPAVTNNDEPEGNEDPRDPLNASEEEGDRPNPPMGDPLADVDANGDDEAPETVAAMNDEENENDNDNAKDPDNDDNDDDDDESELEELSEKEFEDFDESALNIPDVPIQVDDSNVGLLGVHKRQRTDEEDRERKKRKKEKRREKPKRSKRTADGEDGGFEDGDDLDVKRSRKSRAGGEGRSKPRRMATPEDEETLSPEERRRRALDRKMDEALKTNRPKRRRNDGGIDIEKAVDDEIANMRQRIDNACILDAEAHENGEVAMQKLNILPDLMALMNRNTIQSAIVDPDLNLLESIRYMLEPLRPSGVIPNHQIQSELFTALSKLPIGKEALKASQIGKIVLYYIKSRQPQPEIKRQAEKLIGEWMRIVLNKEKTMRNRPVETKVFDPLAQRAPGASQLDRAAMAAEKRRRALAVPVPGNRARVEGTVGTYRIAPVNNMAGMTGLNARRGGGDEAFKRIAARGAAKTGGAGGSRR